LFLAKDREEKARTDSVKARRIHGSDFIRLILLIILEMNTKVLVF
jgi:hypothetical protein